MALQPFPPRRMVNAFARRSGIWQNGKQAKELRSRRPGSSIISSEDLSVCIATMVYIRALYSRKHW